MRWLRSLCRLPGPETEPTRGTGIAQSCPAYPPQLDRLHEDASGGPDRALLLEAQPVEFRRKQGRGDRTLSVTPRQPTDFVHVPSESTTYPALPRRKSGVSRDVDQTGNLTFASVQVPQSSPLKRHTNGARVTLGSCVAAQGPTTRSRPMAQILCVDDDPPILKYYRKVLASQNHEVRTCSGGESGLTAFDNGRPDLVILDLDMPGLSGLETCAEIRKRRDGFDVPIIMVSGYGDEDSILQCLSAGADDYLLKPVNTAELLAKIKHALRKDQQRREMGAGFEPGSRFADRFEILAQTGAGGFGEVYRAMDLSRGIEVALKVFEIPHEQRSDTTFISSLLREAYQMSRLDFPTIVRFFDFGQSGVFYYLAMEHLHGRSLRDVVTEDGVLEESDLVVIAHEIARAIQYLSEANMVHGDVKPGNIMLTDDGSVKLLDFGLAGSSSDLRIAMSGCIVTTPAYASPESFYPNSKLDSRSDLYSLGGALYFGATAVPPFPGDTVDEVLAIRFGHQPTPVRELNPNISDAFAGLVGEMLADSRDERPQVDCVIEALARLLPVP